jgi:periplasmic protein TonB
MSMNRAEQIGLGSAVGGHAFLLLLLSLGIFGASERLVPPEPIAVSLVGETAPEATSPKPSADEAAPSTLEQSEPEPPAAAPDAAPEPPAPPLEKAIAKPVAKPIVKPEPRPLPVTKPAPVVAKKPPVKATPQKPTPQKPAAKPVAAKSKPAATKPSPSKTTKPAVKSGGFGKGFEDRIAGLGNSGTPRTSPAAGQGKSPTAAAPPGKPATEVRRSVNAALASQIKPFLESCAPSGVDMDAIRTFITLSLDRNGALIGARFDKQTGVNASNSPQADPLKQCALRAAKQASPYRGLDVQYYDVWKTHALQLKAK